MWILVILICLILIIVWNQYYREVLIDGRPWKVVDSYENAPAAAKLMADVHSRAVRFMRFLREKYQIDKPGAELPKTPKEKRMYALLDNYNPDRFYENDPRFSSDTSYTINKGEKMFICLRNKDSPTGLIDSSTVFFVLLHEMAHIANYDGWGHDRKFWRVFKDLLQEAEKSGVYVPVDYSENPITYCGLDVNYNPYFDETLDPI